MKTDMSPHAITQRIKKSSELRRLCIALGSNRLTERLKHPPYSNRSEDQIIEVSQMKTTNNFWRTKTYQGKIRYVTLYRERLSDVELKKLKDEFSDILIVESFIFYFSAYETRPVERRFGCFEEFTSSYITKIDRKAGRIAALRRWWHVQKMVDEKSCIDRDRPDLDLAGDDWKPMDLPDDDRKIDYLPWE